MSKLMKLRCDQKGASALEFALAAPSLILFLFGFFNLGIIMLADAGLKSAVGEAARYATLFPTPSDAQIKTRLTESAFGLKNGTIGTPTVTRGEIDDQEYVDISLSYSYVVDPVIIPGIPVELTETRRTYLQSS